MRFLFHYIFFFFVIIFISLQSRSVTESPYIDKVSPDSIDVLSSKSGQGGLPGLPTIPLSFFTINGKTYIERADFFENLPGKSDLTCLYDDFSDLKGENGEELEELQQKALHRKQFEASYINFTRVYNLKINEFTDIFLKDFMFFLTEGERLSQSLNKSINSVPTKKSERLEKLNKLERLQKEVDFFLNFVLENYKNFYSKYYSDTYRRMYDRLKLLIGEGDDACELYFGYEDSSLDTLYTGIFGKDKIEVFENISESNEGTNNRSSFFYGVIYHLESLSKYIKEEIEFKKSAVSDDSLKSSLEKQEWDQFLHSYNLFQSFTEQSRNLFKNSFIAYKWFLKKEFDQILKDNLEFDNDDGSEEDE